MPRLLLVLCLTAAGCAYPPETAGRVPVDQELWEVAWLAGSWVAVSEDGARFSEEHWTDPAGGTMIGVNRTVVEDRTVFFEYLRIERTPQGVVYLASPQGRAPPTPFRLIRSDRGQVVFENLDHGFPQRVIYRREGDRLHASVEGMQDGEMRIERWSWQRSTSGFAR